MPGLTEAASFIFDLDGLLLDTEATYFAAWQQGISRMGYSPNPADFARLSGQHYSNIEAYLRERYGAGFDLATFLKTTGAAWRQIVEAEGIRVMPGVTTWLDFAQDNHIPVCVATNSVSTYARECLRLAGINERFPALVAGDEVANAKPAPDSFIKAAELLDADIRRCLIFEDSPTGIRAAAEAGGRVVFVPSIRPPEPAVLALCHFHFATLQQAFEAMHGRQDII